MDDIVNKKNLILKYIYKSESSSIINFLMPFIVVFIFFVIIINYTIQIDLAIANLNWDTNKCVPKYMFVSGFVNSNKTEGILEYTKKNFNKCIKQLSK
jgi:hypothetical protein